MTLLTTLANQSMGNQYNDLFSIINYTYSIVSVLPGWLLRLALLQTLHHPYVETNTLQMDAQIERIH